MKMNHLIAKALCARQLGANILPHRCTAATSSLKRLASVSRSSSSLARHPGTRRATFIGTSQRFISNRTSPLMMMASPKGEEILAALSNKQQTGQNVELAVEALANADAVCFDVDSTVIDEEGIDVLADFLGQGEAVAALTKKAMEGSQKFQDALKDRLELMKPSKQSIEKCLTETPLKFTPGVEELIESLTEKGVDVYLVSGGFRIMIEPIAKKLCVARDRIYANTIYFDEDGNYTGFDPNEPTSRDMGKPKALEIIKKAGNYSTMVMVGDGATDAQAKPPANAFIGFGGIVVRSAVKEKADWFVTDFKDMTEIIKKYAAPKLK